MERDPIGKDQHEPGAKLDAGKNRLGLVLNAFSHALIEVGHVGTYGANKYTENGWLEVPNGVGRYTDAMYRHLLAEATGEKRDADTDLLHAAHAAWNALARLELLIRTDQEKVAPVAAVRSCHNCKHTDLDPELQPCNGCKGFRRWQAP